MLKLIKYCFYIFVISIVVFGLCGYFITNASQLIRLSVGAKEQEKVSPEENSTIVQEPVENFEEESLETLMLFPKKPAKFLDEVLPELTPDPDREFGDVIIKDYSQRGSLVSNFYVNDSSETGLDLAEVVNYKLPFKIDDYSVPTVLIYHTHTTESYLNGYTGFYYKDDNFRNSDPKRNVVAIGDVLQEKLAEYGIIAIHDETIHDSPQYTGSYTRSLETVKKNLELYPTIKITIDLHRDSITDSKGNKYKTTANINGQDAAQIMVITGADPTGELGFDNWDKNLIFATKIQQTASEMYEGLTRPLMFCQRKYNMFVTTGSLLFEVGNEVNTFAEAKYSAKLMADVLNKVLKEK